MINNRAYFHAFLSIIYKNKANVNFDIIKINDSDSENYLCSIFLDELEFFKVEGKSFENSKENVNI